MFPFNHCYPSRTGHHLRIGHQCHLVFFSAHLCRKRLGCQVVCWTWEHCFFLRLLQFLFFFIIIFNLVANFCSSFSGHLFGTGRVQIGHYRQFIGISIQDFFHSIEIKKKKKERIIFKKAYFLLIFYPKQKVPPSSPHLVIDFFLFCKERKEIIVICVVKGTGVRRGSFFF